MTTYGAALAEARAALARAGVDGAARDARLLLLDAAGLDAAALIARDREDISRVARSAFDAHMKRRMAGEPVARILGQKEFWGLPFKLDAATLVPRDDTETLVERVLEEARRRPPDISICDLGTGSGAILIALLTELPEAHGTATDISQAALAMARENADRLGVAARIAFREASFAQGPCGRFDMVVSNPPYVESGAIAGLSREVRDHDPRAALDGGPDGLDAYRTILGRLPELVAEGGFVAFEVGHEQGERVAALCREARLEDISIARDLAGRDRVVTGSGRVFGKEPKTAKKALGKVGVSG